MQPTSSQDMIVLENVWKIFGYNADEAMAAIKERNLSKNDVLTEFGCVVGIADCSFSVRKGEVFCVMGLSGSGKSTMVRHLNRLIEPTAGKINVLGRDIPKRNKNMWMPSKRMCRGWVLNGPRSVMRQTIFNNFISGQLF